MYPVDNHVSNSLVLLFIWQYSAKGIMALVRLVFYVGGVVFLRIGPKIDSRFL